ncbi:MAG: 23S rRNA pseudouridine(1911/1915/1917) synthase RluD [Burkholderiales bacterium]|nr:23S rRNA pseudouridine(1911/1915/1917) synthase RluD [Burkholderiales bacterium]
MSIYLPHTEYLEPIITTIPNNLAGMRLDAALNAIIPELSRTKLTNLIKSGAILIDNKIIKPKEKVLGGENITINLPLSEETLAFTPQNIPLNIIYEDSDILVINKPSNLTVHPGHGNWSNTLLNGLLFHYPELKYLPRAGIVHRLDKDTTGLMVIAKTLIAQNNLVQQLQNRSVTRIYHAIVEGHTAESGIIQHNIGRDPSNRIKMTTLAFGGKEAITHFQVLKYFEYFSYIECKLETGRTHQIRVHLKSLGHPLVGDQTYGSKKRNYPEVINNAITQLNRQALHALKLSLIHPVNNQIMEFTSPLSQDMQDMLQVIE